MHHQTLYSVHLRGRTKWFEVTFLLELEADLQTLPGRCRLTHCGAAQSRNQPWLFVHGMICSTSLFLRSNRTLSGISCRSENEENGRESPVTGCQGCSWGRRRFEIQRQLRCLAAVLVSAGRWGGQTQLELDRRIALVFSHFGG